MSKYYIFIINKFYSVKIVIIYDLLVRSILLIQLVVYFTLAINGNFH